MKYSYTSLVAAMLVTAAWSAPVAPAAHSLEQRGLVDGSLNNPQVISSGVQQVEQALPDLPEPKQPDLSQPLSSIHLTRQADPDDKNLPDVVVPTAGPVAEPVFDALDAIGDPSAVLDQGLPNLPKPGQQPDLSKPPSIHVARQTDPDDGALPDVVGPIVGPIVGPVVDALGAIGNDPERNEGTPPAEA